MRVLRLAVLICVWTTVSAVVLSDDDNGDPAGRDAVLDWNSVLLQANVDDHSGTFGAPEQGGPTRTARAFAIVHVAMFDALNCIHPTAQSYLSDRPAKGASIDAAVATAAHDTLVAMYPKQSAAFDDAYQDYLIAIPKSSARKRGIELGEYAAKKILKAREHDGSDIDVPYIPTGAPGNHDVDPVNPGQGFLTPGWGMVTPFGLSKRFDFAVSPPPALESTEYAVAFNDVKDLGGDGLGTPTLRTEEQTLIGLYWAYDGTKGLGVPPRLYNQIARTIADQEGNTEAENARMFALINIAMADAGIVCWDIKYVFDFWRPILGIRRAGEHENDEIEPDPTWTPLGAPNSNREAIEGANNFTPPFPAYTSGHATFGAATFGVLQRFYGSDDIPFTFVSDELNGVTTDNMGNERPLAPRAFLKLSDAALENARSRIYLGIHWQFDADEGVRFGYDIADDVFDNVLKPLP